MNAGAIILVIISALFLILTIAVDGALTNYMAKREIEALREIDDIRITCDGIQKQITEEKQKISTLTENVLQRTAVILKTLLDTNDRE